MGRPRPLEERFWEKVNKHTLSGCWEWTGFKNKFGYGMGSFGEGRQYAHRISYEFYKGKIPAGLHLDHLCRVHDCVNPDHLEAVTPKENNLRGFGPPAINARKTHCEKGHPFKGTLMIVSQRGWRQCRVCRKESNYADYWKNRARILARKKELRDARKKAAT